jgi:hypothetical protein
MSYFSKTSSDDSESAFKHYREEVLTIQCGECGELIAFKISGRNNGLNINILTDGHNCPTREVIP